MSQPPYVGPVRAATSHFGRDPPIRFHLNPQYDSNPHYDPAPIFCIAADNTVTSGGAADAFQHQSLKTSLANQQAADEAASAPNESGGLSQSALNGSRPIIPPRDLGNPNIPTGFGKYATETYNSPSGPFQVHFYQNPDTGEIYYGVDYKAVFNAPGGK